jgi:PadR family transcriptional regulator PadR
MPATERPIIGLSSFQRDVLAIVGRTGPAKGLTIKAALEDGVYDTDTVYHSHLYTNLDRLADAGFIEKGESDRRTNHYTLTPRGHDDLRAYHVWLGECLASADQARLGESAESVHQ